MTKDRELANHVEISNLDYVFIANHKKQLIECFAKAMSTKPSYVVLKSAWIVQHDDHKYNYVVTALHSAQPNPKPTYHMQVIQQRDFRYSLIPLWDTVRRNNKFINTQPKRKSKKG